MDKEEEQKVGKDFIDADKVSKNLSRRTFIKKAVVGSIAVASTAGLAKKLISMDAEDAANKACLKDELQQDRVVAQQKYVLMTKEEKEQMVQMLVNSYKEQA